MTSSSDAAADLPERRERALQEARAALDDYDTNQAWYAHLPQSEAEGRNCERYEDGLLQNVHDLADALRELLIQRSRT